MLDVFNKLSQQHKPEEQLQKFCDAKNYFSKFKGSYYIASFKTNE